MATDVDYRELPIVKEHIERGGRQVAEDAYLSFTESVHGVLGMSWSHAFESPLEVLFWIWWSACEHANRYVAERLSLEHQLEVLCEGQRYRLDFCVVPTDPVLVTAIAEGRAIWKPIAIEVDGHAFHERTPEQVGLRDRRDRALQKAGWQVFHYSWTEFTTNPNDCISEVFCFARDQMNRSYVARTKT